MWKTKPDSTEALTETSGLHRQMYLVRGYVNFLLPRPGAELPRKDKENTQAHHHGDGYDIHEHRAEIHPNTPPSPARVGGDFTQAAKNFPQ
jgi:hypothetical protein